MPRTGRFELRSLLHPLDVTFLADKGEHRGILARAVTFAYALFLRRHVERLTELRPCVALFLRRLYLGEVRADEVI